MSPIRLTHNAESNRLPITEPVQISSQDTVNDIQHIEGTNTVKEPKKMGIQHVSLFG